MAVNEKMTKKAIWDWFQCSKKTMQNH